MKKITSLLFFYLMFLTGCAGSGFLMTNEVKSLSKNYSDAQRITLIIEREECRDSLPLGDTLSTNNKFINTMSSEMVLLRGVDFIKISVSKKDILNCAPTPIDTVRIVPGIYSVKFGEFISTDLTGSQSDIYYSGKLRIPPVNCKLIVSVSKKNISLKAE